MAKINLEEYILVTEINRPLAVVLGRVVYMIRDKKLLGRIYVRPQLRKGKLTIENDPVMGGKKYMDTIREDETQEEWIQRHKPVLDKVISEGYAYIKKEDTLVTYTQ